MHRPRHDRLQHRLQVERRADRLPDLAERRELIDRPGERLGALLQLLEQPRFWIAITACSQKVVSRAISFSENGPTRSRPTNTAPMPRPPEIMGAKTMDLEPVMRQPWRIASGTSRAVFDVGKCATPRRRLSTFPPWRVGPVRIQSMYSSRLRPR